MIEQAAYNSGGEKQGRRQPKPHETAPVEPPPGGPDGQAEQQQKRKKGQPVQQQIKGRVEPVGCGGKDIPGRKNGTSLEKEEREQPRCAPQENSKVLPRPQAEHPRQ